MVRFFSPFIHLQCIVRSLFSELVSSELMHVFCCDSLSMLVQKFHSDQVVEVVDKLGKLIVETDQKESRDIYAIGLKTMIQSVRDEDGEAISSKLLKSLVVGLKKSVTAPAPAGGAK